MRENFDRALRFIFKCEGEKLENVAGDKGGETKFGIDKESHPDIDIEALTKEGAAEIYRESYWDKVRGDQLPFPLDIALMDYAVNSGINKAVRTLQRILGGTVADGILGKVTLSITMQQNAAMITSLLLAERTAYLKKIVANHPDQEKFLAGWLNRVSDLRKEIATNAAGD